MLITCPYCHKKVNATNYQLIVKGRLRLVCPNCRRFLFGALRKQLLIMQGVVLIAAVALCAWLGSLAIPGGVAVKLLLLLLGLVAVVAMMELSARWISRPSILQYRTDKLIQKEKDQEATRKEAERAANRKKNKHKKK